MTKKPTNYRLTTPTLDQIDTLASALGESRTDVITRAVQLLAVDVVDGAGLPGLIQRLDCLAQRAVVLSQSAGSQSTE